MRDDEIAGQLAIAVEMMSCGQIEASRTLLKRLHKLYPKHTEIMLQLAIAERLLKQWPQAIALMKAATALAPKNILYAEHYANMLMLSNDGRSMAQAIDVYANILRAQPDSPVIATNQLLLALRCDRPLPILASLAPLISGTVISDPDARVHLPAACAMASYLLNDMPRTHDYVAMTIAANADFKDAPFADPYYLLIYTKFLADLLAYRSANPDYYTSASGATPLHVIGESHCLSPAHMTLAYRGEHHVVVPHLIMGAKAYYFTLEAATTWKYSLEECIRKLPKNEPIIICFGEIDCRSNEGIMEQYRTHPDYAMVESITTLCAAYVKFVKIAQLRRNAPLDIMGVPAPHRDAAKYLTADEVPIFLQMIRSFNTALAQASAHQGLGFLDVYAVTADAEGWAKDGVHIDYVHLKPAVVAALFQRKSNATNSTGRLQGVAQ